MVKEELNTTAGFIALVAILAIMVILLAVLALVVVRALAESPWGIFTVSATIPIAMFMGGYLRYGRVGKVMEASAIGVICLLLAVWGGRVVHGSPGLAHLFSLRDISLAWALIAYGLAASILPVWLLLAPRDYLSTFMKLGTIFALAIGIFLVLPHLQMPAVSRFIDGSGPVVAGKVFPFCFITIACGAISGFHTLIASGTTPKLITRESYSRPIGYGAMCLESLVAIMALIAACTLDPGVYFGMNMKGEAAITAATVTELGFPLSVEHMNQLADQLGEKTLFGRTGGAATLAVGMAQIFSTSVSGRWMDLWYHFAIMFEALFILTTIDAGTRVGRYLLQDVLGQVWSPLGRTKHLGANLLASLLIVGAWGYFLIQGVRDPLGGINSLWPLFGIANQMLAAIALCLATTILLKMSLDSNRAKSTEEFQITGGILPRRRPVAFAAITFLPLLWLLAVTATAGVQKVTHNDPRIGFLAQARVLESQLPDLEQTLARARPGGGPEAVAAAEHAVRVNRILHFNALLDAVVTSVFLLLVAAIVLLSSREWILLLARRKPAALFESKAIWLPETALAEARRPNLAGLAALGFALAKELSGEAEFERAPRVTSELCSEPGGAPPTAHGCQPCANPEQKYLEMTERRFEGVRRCC